MNLLNIFLMAGNQQGGASGWSSMLMLLLIIVIFYFFMIRPQSARAKKEKQFRESLQKGQKIVTISGMHGKIVEVKETSLILEIANGVNVEIEKTAIALEIGAEKKK